MKKLMFRANALFPKVILAWSIPLMLLSSCKKNEPPPALFKGYHQTNLIADVTGFGAARVDPALVNAWGMSFSPTSPIWISAAKTSVTIVVDKDGTTKIPTVTIQNGQGSPTGQVNNSTTSFVIPGTNKPAKFIFVDEDGTVTAWNGGTTTVLVADRSLQGAVYKGLAMANDGAGNFLYATNFKNSKIDVFDSTFKYVSDKSFQDNSIPADYGPFNIRLINGNLYVTYAKHHAPDNEDDEKGAGNGYVNIFSPKGQLIKRFISKGALNSPWGIVPSVPGSTSIADAILIGNFGDGLINIYSNNGDFMGSLKDNMGHNIVIDGLWALENKIFNADPEHIYFTAGPNDETHGLFGYLSKDN